MPNRIGPDPVCAATPKKVSAGRFPPYIRTLAIAAGGAAAILVAWGIWVIIKDKDGNEVGKMLVPQEGSVVVQDTKDIPSADASKTRDRETAEWIFRKGGWVNIRTPGQDWVLVGKKSPLPDEPFQLRKAYLNQCKIEGDELSRLSGCSTLYEISLQESNVIGAQLDHLRDLPALNLLNLHKTRISGTDLQFVSRLASLNYLLLSATSVGDDGLPFLNSLKNLRQIKLQQTKVTAAGIEKLQAALPKCEIIWDGKSPTPPTASSNVQVASPPFQPAAGDLALSFDAAKKYVYVPSLKLNFSQPITIEAYVTPAAGDGIICSVPNQGGLFMRTGNWAYSVSLMNPASYSTITPGRMELGRRVHVAGVCTGKQVRVYIGGQRIVTHELPADPLTTEARTLVEIGRNVTGLLDEIRVSRVARYDQDFTPAQRFVTDPDTLALFHCDEGRGGCLWDSSGNDHHGQINGGTWARADGSPLGNSTPQPLESPAASLPLRDALGAVTILSPSPCTPQRLADKFIVDPAPDYLKGTAGLSYVQIVGQPSETHGMVEFRVERAGPLYLAASWEYDGNPSGNWAQEALTSEQIQALGWKPVGQARCRVTTIPTPEKPYDDLHTFFVRDCKVGETFKIRSRKYRGPILFVPGIEK